MSRIEHLVLLVSLLVAGLGLHHLPMFETGPLVDEEFYESGFSALVETGSSYQAEGFMYPPTFASAGVWLQDRLGAIPLRYSVRWINFLCLVGLLWFTVVRFVDDRKPKQRPLWAYPVVALLLMAAPGVRLGLYVGNVSFSIGVLIVVGFWWSQRRPFVSGLLLAASLLMKPLAAGALPLLLLPVRDSESRASGVRTSTKVVRSRWLTAAVAGLVGLGILWFFRTELPRMFNTEMTSMAQNRSLSFYRISRLLGFGEQRLLLFGVVTLGLCLVLWGRLKDRTDLLVGALTAIPLTTLAVWSHTLVLLFPVGALALSRLLARRFPEEIRLRVWQRMTDVKRLEVVTVVGCLVLVYFVHSGGFPQLPPAAQIALLTLPTLAPMVLLGYWLVAPAPVRP